MLSCYKSNLGNACSFTDQLDAANIMNRICNFVAIKCMRCVNQKTVE